VTAVGPEALARATGKIAAVGPGTAAALPRVDLVPSVHKGDDLAIELARTIPPGARVLLARAEIARDVVPDALRAAGVVVDVVAVYRTEAAPRPRIDALVTELEEGRIDAITFTSSSTVDHLVAALGPRADVLGRVCLASIGPITTATAEKHGLRIAVTAREHTVPGLVAALEEHFGSCVDAEPD
jgi:uroporphyrinogen III methyltransferase/synthase